MTREEAIHRIKDHMVHHGMGRYPHVHLAEAMEMAITALRQMDYLIKSHQVIEIKSVPEKMMAQIKEALKDAKICILERTHADRIRSMSDEQMAEFLFHCMHTNSKALNKGQVTEWLKQLYISEDIQKQKYISEDIPADQFGGANEMEEGV